MAIAVEDLNSDVLGKILLLLEGLDLAAVSAASRSLRAAATSASYHLCLSTWPSLHHERLLPLLSSNPRSFFSDAFPYPLFHACPPATPSPTELISAVDLFENGRSILSTAVATETRSQWFESAPYRVTAFEAKGSTRSPEIVGEATKLTLNWLVIDPSTGRAVNISSRSPVAVDNFWCDGEVRVKFGVALGEHAAAVLVVAIEAESRRVREVSMTIESGEEGTCSSGKDAVAVLTAAMYGERSWKEGREVERRYREYVKRKVENRRKEERGELGCALLGAAAFLTFLAAMAFR